MLGGTINHGASGLRWVLTVTVVVVVLGSVTVTGVAEAGTAEVGTTNSATPETDCNDELSIEPADRLQVVQSSWAQDTGGHEVRVDGARNGRNFGATDDVASESVRTTRQTLPLVRGKDALLFGASRSGDPTKWPADRQQFEFVVINRRTGPNPDGDDSVEFKVRLAVFDGDDVYRWTTEQTYEVDVCESDERLPTKRVSLSAPMPAEDRWNRQSGPYDEAFQMASTGSQWVELEVVDPDPTDEDEDGNTIHDGNLDDHRTGVSVDVVDTPRLDLLYQPLTIADPSASHPGLAVYDLHRMPPRQSYVQATFPLAENDGRVKDGIEGTNASGVYAWCGDGWFTCTYGSVAEFNRKTGTAENLRENLSTSIPPRMAKTRIKSSKTDRVVVVLPKSMNLSGVPGWYLHGTRTVFVSSSWSKETLGHELMHSFDVSHAHGYDAGPDDNYGDPADIQHVEADGYRTNSGGLPGAARTNVWSTMSVAGGHHYWIAKPNYRHLLDEFAGEPEPPNPPEAKPSSPDANPPKTNAAGEKSLLVTGVLNRTSGIDFEADPFYEVDRPETTTLSPGTNGTLAFVVETTDGETARYGFDPEFAMAAEPEGTLPTNVSPVAYYLPTDGVIERVELRNATNETIFERERSASAPTASVSAPTPTGTAPGNVTLEWEATDADGESVATTVFVRPNGSSSWQLVVADTGRREARLSGLPNGSTEVSVLATDGIRTVERTTTFTVAPATGPVERADENGDGEISTGELQAAIAEWATGEIDTPALQSIIQAWVTGA